MFEIRWYEMTKINKKRWDVAQKSEKGYWETFTTGSLLGALEDPYKKKLEFFIKKWEKIIKINESTRILQIGSGPLDVINYIKVGKRYAIDPLADFYKERFNIDYKSVDFKQAPGEDIPYPDKYFDLIIINNVLDHTHLPKKVLSEINRILKDDGIMHLEVQVYQRSFLIISKLWAPIKKLFTKKMFNIHHPYMFLLSDVEKLIKKDFSIIFKKHESLDELKEKRKKEKITKNIPALFGILGNIYYIFICKKKINP